jgi:hypothetical protein
LELEAFEIQKEIIEGLLSCTRCNGIYPIINSVPFLVEDLSMFFSIRAKLGGYLLLNVKNKKIKYLIRKSLQQIQKVGDDTTDLEKNWAVTYKKSKPSAFQINTSNIVKKLQHCNFVIEHGCSIGTMSAIAAKYHGKIFGIDKSFFALLEAKKRKISNVDFFLADSLSMPFGTMKFDAVMALNVLELIEPIKLLKTIKLQAQKFVIISDPYDYERGKSSVKVSLDAKSLRSKLKQAGFKIIDGTGKPSFISWKLDVNPRLELNYKVDLILAVVLHQ